uniref:Piwi domain-containing protein n=1 Tax=Strongyloides papillosus TaxID=174720 RepID=A0A0N5BRH5_STREA
MKYILRRKKYNIYHIDLNEDVQSYVNKFSKIIDNNCKYLKVVLFFDDICVNNLCTGHTKNGNISHSAYKIIHNNDTENTSTQMSQIVHYRTYALCMTNIAKCDKYESYINFVLSQFENRSIRLFDGNEIILKIHCIIGDHPLMQSIFKHIQNYRSVGRINACRACTLLPNEYESHMACSMTRSFLKNILPSEIAI